MFIVKNGFMPVTKGIGKNIAGSNANSILAYGSDYSNYGLHIVPNPKNPLIKNFHFSKPIDPNPYDQAVSWAQYLKKRHSYFPKYQMDFNNPDHHRASMRFDFENDKDVQKNYNLPNPIQNFKSGSVVLAISDDVLNNFKVQIGGDGDDLNIITNNLPVKFIIGIEPQDDQTYDYLDQLSSQN